jgi:protein O-mannosyl-transferase
MNDHPLCFERDRLLVWLLPLLIFIIYLNAITGEFVFDDRILIEENDIIHSLDNWKAILFEGYRPIRTLVLAILYHFFQLNPVGYHLFNIAIHLMMVGVVYLLCKEVSQNKIVALFSAFIYATHPIQTDSVTYIAGIRDTLSSLFYVTGVYYFVRYLRSGRYLLFAASVGFYVIGAFTKEIVATMVFTFFFYQFIITFPTDANWSLKNLFVNVWITTVKVLRTHRMVYFGLFVFFCFIVYYYLFMQHATPRVRSDGVSWYGGSMLLNYLTIPKIVMYYIKQLLWPMHLLTDYKFFPIVARNPYEPMVILSIMMVSLIVVLTLYLLNRNKPAAFGIIWFFITLAPMLNILPHHEFMAEHYLYLPMVGFSLVVGIIFNTALMNAGLTKKAFMVVLAFGILIGGYSIRTIMRNLDWQNSLVLAKAQLKIRPNSPRTLMEMGYLYNYMNLPHAAEEKLRQSLRLQPEYGPSLNNLSQAFLRYAEYESAIELFRLASETKVHPALKSRVNLGLALLSVRRKEEGKMILGEVLSRFPDERRAAVSLAYAYLFDKNYEKAAEYVRHNLRYHPRDIESYFLLADVYRKVFTFESAAKLYDIILEIEPDNQKAIELKKVVVKNNEELRRVKEIENNGPLSPEGYLLLANLYVQIKENELAANKLKEALSRYPEKFELWKKYTIVLLDQMKIDEALDAAKKAVTINPQDPEARFMLARGYSLNLEFNKSSYELGLIKETDLDKDDLSKIKDLIKIYAPKVEMAQQLLSRKKNDTDALLLLGDVFISLGMVDKAMEQYEAILAASPEHHKAKFYLARMHLRKNSPLDTREAINLLQSVLDENPNDVDVRNSLGVIYMTRLDNFESAHYHFRESIQSDPNQEEAERIQRLVKVLDDYIKAVTVEDKYLLPFIVDELQYERWLIPVETKTSLL